MVSPPPGLARAVSSARCALRDRLDDGESQPVSVVVASAGVDESFERFEQALDLFGRHGRAGVRDRHDGVPVAGRGRDLEVSTGRVVADRVVDQVGDQALEESGIAERRCGVEPRLDIKAQPLRPRGAALAALGLPGRRGRDRSRRSSPAWPRVRASNASISCSRCCSDASTRSWALRSEAKFASELASATSISARWRVSGARSSCEAFATNWRCASVGVLERLQDSRRHEPAGQEREHGHRRRARFRTGRSSWCESAARCAA